MADAVERVIKLLQMISEMRGVKVLESSMLYLSVLMIGAPVNNLHLTHAQTKCKCSLSHGMAVTGQYISEDER